MKNFIEKVIVIPTFWADPEDLQAGEDDQNVCYDHPTPLDQQGTLPHALESLGIVKASDFTVVVIAVAQSQAIQEAVEARVRSLLKAHAKLHVPLYLFSYSHLRRLRRHLNVRQNEEEFEDLFCLEGYSNVRNAALFIAQMLKAEALIFIDDDEYLDDADFLDNATRFLGTNQGKKPVEAVAGFYRYPHGGYRLEEGDASWQIHWNPARWMNRAFERSLEGLPRLRKATFAFGGCFVLARSLLERLPFDPCIPRGEDIDYLINARLINVPIWLDNQLSVVHSPPAKTVPHWKQLRIDARRFLYERAKLDPIAAEKAGFHPLSSEELQPYPGVVLGEDLESRLIKAHQLLAEAYRRQGESGAAQACLKTLERIPEWRISAEAVFDHLTTLRRRWQQLGRILSCIVRDSDEIQGCLERVE